jgi:hypothetical protein
MKDDESVFAEALRKASAEERAVFLDQACDDDAELRGEVEALLRAHASAAAFLESPPRALADGTGAMRATGNGDGDGASAPPIRVGAVLGSYKLLERIGEGGMGVVFRAGQTQPVRRQVALKLIRPGLDSAQFIARFQMERQALALMEHPGIARVLDAGTTDDGRPYFVMELVRGIPVTDYFDQERLTPAQRLKLFRAGLPGRAACPHQRRDPSRHQADERPGGDER